MPFASMKIKRYGLILMAVVSILITVLLGFTISNDTRRLNDIWHGYVEKESVKSSALASIIIGFGYGGFIHNYKNLILRQDQKYATACQNALDNTFVAIDTYISLEDDQVNIDNVNLFKETVIEYNKSFKTILDLIKDGKSASEIDKVVIIDDSKALESLEYILLTLRKSSSTILDESISNINGLQKTILIGFIFIVLSLIIATTLITANFTSVLAAYKEITILLSSVPNAIIVTDAKGKIKRINKKAISIFGYTRNEFIGMSLEKLIPQRYRVAHIQARVDFQKSDRTVAMDSRTTAFIALRKNGDEFPVQISVSTFNSKNEKKNIAVIQDMSTEKQLKDDANKDHLTNLANRKKSFEFLANAINQSKRYNHPLSVIMCDIDYFKKINDSFGHNMGDDVLVKVASILQNGIRDTDLLARWGGEEFLIICPETTKGNAYILAEHLRSKIKLAFQNTKTPVTLSLGVTEFEMNNDMEDIFIERADNALYASKNNGRNKTSIH